MSPKNILTISLLVFVAAGILVLTVKGLRQGSQGQHTAAAIEDGVMVYYFHGNARCPTCRNIEAYAHEAVQSGFADELNSGEINWQVINYESPGNEHYAADYEVVAPNVVLVRFKDGKQVSWKGLTEVWEYVGDKPTFVDLVQKSLRDFMQQTETRVSSAPPGTAK